MPSFITRGVIMVVGYIYPAYECFKSVEKHAPDIDTLRFWCQYWMIIAIVTVAERLGDTLISWLPLYSEAKLAFIVYLWYPKTKGTTYVYSTFLKPFLSRHESEIDQNLNELMTKAGETLFLSWQTASAYAQTRFYEVLQYFASQSRSAKRQAGPNFPSHSQPPPPPPGYQPPSAPPPENNPPPPSPGYRLMAPSGPTGYQLKPAPNPGMHYQAVYRVEEEVGCKAMDSESTLPSSAAYTRERRQRLIYKQ